MADRGQGLGDGHGTRIGAPDEADEADEAKRVTPATHNDGPSGRPDRVTGAGREATAAGAESSPHDQDHRSGYGGKAGAPDTSSDKR